MVNQGGMESAQEQSNSGDTEPVELSGDLVCGLLVGPGSATERVRHEGQDYYFCSPRCAEEFRSDPSTYLKPAGDGKGDGQPILDSGGENGKSTVFDWAVIYTCPMHPEVDLSVAGACPKCGMAAEPRTFMLEDE